MCVSWDGGGERGGGGVTLSKLFCLHSEKGSTVKGINLLPRRFITKTSLYNFDPLKPHFYLVKLGFTEVYIIFLISAQKHRLWVLFRTASARQF